MSELPNDLDIKLVTEYFDEYSINNIKQVNNTFNNIVNSNYFLIFSNIVKNKYNYKISKYNDNISILKHNNYCFSVNISITALTKFIREI